MGKLQKYNDAAAVEEALDKGITAHEALDGHTVKSDVPADAKFTDTVYDDTAVKADILANTEATQQNKTDILLLNENALMKNQGAENVGKILVVGTDGNVVLTDIPEGGASGDVTGVLDESNNILLSGNLADGTYTLKYENEDGTYTEIGTLNVGEIEKPKTNFAGTVAVGRLSNSSASNVATDSPSARITDFISVMTGDVLSVQGFTTITTSPNFSFMTFDSSKAKLGVLTNVSGASTDYALTQETTNTGSIVEIISDSVAYIRFSGKPSGAEEDIVVNIQRNGEWL